MNKNSTQKFFRNHLKNRIWVQGQGGAEFQPAGILKYVEDLKREPNAEIGPKGIFEIPYRIGSCRGFTLLEIMAAVAIIAIVLVSVYQLHARTIAMNSSARFYIMAPLLAQIKVAELEVSAASGLLSDSGDFGDDYPGYTWTVAVENVSAETLGQAAQDFKKLDVMISFNHNEFFYKLRTYSLLKEYP